LESFVFRSLSLSPEQHDVLIRRVVSLTSYRFFDRAFSIASDSIEAIRFFDLFYSKFHDNGPPEKDQQVFYFLIEGIFSRFPLLFWQPGICWEILDLIEPFHVVENMIVDSALSRVKSHILFHGASLVKDGQGVTLCGISGSGKTTLALEFARRGFQILSDEIVALDPVSGLIHPFKRSIACDARTYRLAAVDSESLIRMDGSTPKGGKKYLIDPTRLAGQQDMRPCYPRLMFFLETGEGETEQTLDESNVEIGFAGGLDEFLKVASTIPGIRVTQRREEPTENLVFLRLVVNNQNRASFRDLCRQFDKNIIYRVHRATTSPGSGGEPHLSPLDKRTALKKLLSLLRNKTTEIYFSPEPNPSRLQEILGEILPLISRFSFFRLKPGNLKDTADLIERRSFAPTIS
jgi:hypothetical protein